MDTQTTKIDGFAELAMLESKARAEKEAARKAAQVEAYGVKGMKNTMWRKIFKNTDALEKWVEKNDAEVYGTRSVE